MEESRRSYSCGTTRSEQEKSTCVAPAGPAGEPSTVERIALLELQVTELIAELQVEREARAAGDAWLYRQLRDLLARLAEAFRSQDAAPESARPARKSA